MTEALHYDVVIVGAGPSGLAAAIKLKQLAHQSNQEISVCVLEKAAAIGGHIISGAVMDTRGLDELVPDWRQTSSFLMEPVTSDAFMWLTQKRAWSLPMPGSLKNTGNYIVSLGSLVKWLAAQAETLGVEIFCGFPAQKPLLNEQNQVVGVQTGCFGLEKDGSPGAQYQPGVDVYGRYTLLAEGARGSLSEILIEHFQLRQESAHQTYGLGVKEVWEIAPDKHHPGAVVHTMGWPLPDDLYGGSFLYHLPNNQVSIGLVVGLDYRNPTVSPFHELQLLKTHPYFKTLLEGGRRLGYGARTLNEGGVQSLPTLTFPGGALMGCAAGFLNVARIKGIHLAIKSGMCAAESIMSAWEAQPPVLPDFGERIATSWISSELERARNVRPSFHKGTRVGLIMSAIDQYIFRGKAPWTLSHHKKEDGALTHPYQKCVPRVYPKPDGVLTFDKASSVHLSNTNHREDQPVHLIIKDPEKALKEGYGVYGSPEQYYCPAGVYEILETKEGPTLQINAQNCVHCKTCDIKDPIGNIRWDPPEGGGGALYGDM